MQASGFKSALDHTRTTSIWSYSMLNVLVLSESLRMGIQWSPLRKSAIYSALFSPARIHLRGHVHIRPHQPETLHPTRS